MPDIKTIGVIGAGQMGAGIAHVAAASGYKCLLWDAQTPALDKGYKGICTQLKKLVEKQKITAEDEKKTLANLKAASSLKEFASCDLAVEAIIENVDIKLKLFAELDTILPSSAILASNTSSISITRLAAGTKRSSQVIGMHFMNPVPVMKLVELIRGLQTSDDTYAATKACAEKMGKTTVLAGDGPGFIVNRILCPMINEAIYLLQEGVKPEDIDNAMKLGTNQPMGPLTLADFVGLDTLLFILQILHRELGEDKYRPCPLLVKYVEAGWLGKKTGRGFYSY
ncbi:MAG: 3-hydroxybutyryl-CoA dehydrogenase [Oligoflexia bacterium]|nr:3-hydroxybutyryl-CoA dehydrogenase [Oligoflexia bacterium]